MEQIQQTTSRRRLRRRRPHQAGGDASIQTHQKSPLGRRIKRTATTVTRIFLRVDHRKLVAPTTEQIEMVSAVESDRWGVEEIEAWLRPRPRVVTR